MDEEKPRIALRLGVVEVRRHLESVEDIGKTLACIDSAPANAVHACAVAKQFVVQFVELLSDRRQDWDRRLVSDQRRLAPSSTSL